MNFTPLHWLDGAILVSLVGAVWISRLKDPLRAWRWGLRFSGVALFCALLAAWRFCLDSSTVGDASGSGLPGSFTARYFRLDELSAPLVPLVALLHFLTALSTGRTKMRRFSLSWSLTFEALHLATFTAREPWLVIALLALSTVPPYLELRNRGQSTRVYVLHMAAFVGLMTVGWASGPATSGGAPLFGTLSLLAAILIRCGTVPAHCWLVDWFERASFGNALLFVTPLTGVYAALRLVLPTAPDWALSGIGLVSLATALYGAGMALVQRDVRRWFAYLFLSHASLVLLGLELHTTVSLTGALSFWISATLSLTGLGLTLRALEARFGRLSLTSFQGLYDHSPALAACFLVTGLACVGFPGTLGFVAAELLMQGAVQTSLLLGLAVVLVAALNGIAIVRAYFYLFNGARHASTVSLGITRREQLAVWSLVALIVVGGLFPQPGIASRNRTAETLLDHRGTVAERATEPPALQPANPTGPHPPMFDEQ